MVKHIKHDDSIDIQIRTKFFDEEGHQMENVIEYDPASGYGKRIKLDGPPGTIEQFYRLGGHLELDGNTFTAESHDEDKVDAIRETIDEKVNRHLEPERYEQKIQQKTDMRRAAKAKAGPAATKTAIQGGPGVILSATTDLNKFTATNKIMEGDTVSIDLDKMTVTGITQDYNPSEQERKQRRE